MGRDGGVEMVKGDEWEFCQSYFSLWVSRGMKCFSGRKKVDLVLACVEVIGNFASCFS